MLRRPSSAAKSSPARIASKPFWKSLVVAVRPLHHLSRPPHPLLPKPDHSFNEPQSPVALISEPSSARSLDRDQDSVYASAQNLQELDKSSEQEIDDHYDDHGQDNINGDEMIDSKAEEFIAHFYAQMRLQRLESMERYNAKNSIKIN
ncbi:hypothetical protein Scep_008903 [Stephania cephalantha]|uniref:Uncharacterized protein n=1 Tax=Stephania cephalantha TaxID=152367 RepID=A0AAP0PCL4_9MAGN